MPRPRKSDANRNGKKKRILSNRSHRRKIRQTSRRRTNQSHNPRTHAHPKIIRRRLHSSQPRQQENRRQGICKILPTKKSLKLNMELVTYYIDGKKKTIQAKVLKNPFQKALGLMFRIHPKPLFFTNNAITYIPITSIFCKPFRAIWLDKNFNAIQVTDVKNWKFHIPGSGKYLLEIPLLPKKSKSPSRKSNQ